jgi:hypothetical protein
MKLAVQAPEIKDFVWPELPYKGLSYYSLNDVPIFAGREQDIERCARLVLTPATKVLFLHGSTGCGKSSFLRAGLIPFLERRELGYSFLSDNEEDISSHFIRATDDPLCRMAEVLFQLGQMKRTRMTPAGQSTVDLSECLHPDQNDLQRFVRRSPEELLNVLALFARRIPETLVLIFDQTEEVLTLRPGQSGAQSRAKFFRFIDIFAEAELDIKIVLALRTEYFGRILDPLEYNIFETQNVNYYLLKELSEDDLIRAIVRPTSDDHFGDHGSPRHEYKFRFARGLPQLIAKDLKRAVPAGGILPVMQLVCGRLYDVVRNRNDEALVDITLSDYRGLGGVEGQLDGHVSDVLKKVCLVGGISDQEVQHEIKRWRCVLLSLAKSQIDGTVTTEMVPVANFVEIVRASGCLIPAETAIQLLSKEENRILTEVKVYNSAQRQEIPCVALGHDAIGLALTLMALGENEAVGALSKIKSLSRLASFTILSVVVLIDIIAAIIYFFNPAAFGLESVALINFVGISYVILAFFIASAPPQAFVLSFEFSASIYGMLGFRRAREFAIRNAESLRLSLLPETTRLQARNVKTRRPPRVMPSRRTGAVRKTVAKQVVTNTRDVSFIVRFATNDRPWLKILIIQSFGMFSRWLRSNERLLRTISRWFKSIADLVRSEADHLKSIANKLERTPR